MSAAVVYSAGFRPSPGKWQQKLNTTCFVLFKTFVRWKKHGVFVQDPCSLIGARREKTPFSSLILRVCQELLMAACFENTS